VSVGSTGDERRITNVAPGQNDTDAVNVSQLNQQMTGINQRLDRVERISSQGVAIGAALSQATPVLGGEQTMGAGVGVATFNGEQAVAVGWTYRLSPNTTVSVGGGASGKRRLGSAGVRWSW
jgi:autotransporter adhesin